MGRVKKDQHHSTDEKESGKKQKHATAAKTVVKKKKSKPAVSGTGGAPLPRRRVAERLWHMQSGRSSLVYRRAEFRRLLQKTLRDLAGEEEMLSGPARTIDTGRLKFSQRGRLLLQYGVERVLMGILRQATSYTDARRQFETRTHDVMRVGEQPETKVCGSWFKFGVAAAAGGESGADGQDS
jgi:hypothetical protein